MLYLVKNNRWLGANVAVHGQPGIGLESFDNYGYIAISVAEQMINAKIAVWDS